MLNRRRMMVGKDDIGMEMKQGTITPIEDTLVLEIDVGSDFSHILIWIEDENKILGHGTKTAVEIFADMESGNIYMVSTNNAGTAQTGMANPNGGATVTQNGEMAIFQSKASVGNVFGYFRPVKYNWAAW